MIGTVDVIVQAAKPDFPLTPFKAFVSSPSSVRVRNVPRRIGTWDITSVSVSVDYPDGTTETAACVLTAGVWVGTVQGCETPGDALRGFVVRADGVDENGDAVTGYVLGVGDVEVLNRETALTPGVVTFKGDTGPQGEQGPEGPQGPKGDPGSGAVESVNGKTGDVVLTGEDVMVGGGDSRLVVDAIHNNESTATSHIASRNNPHGVTVDQIGAQRKLTAGENITITADGVISASGGGSAVVESETNPGYAANADHAGSADSANSANSSAYATEAQSAYQAVQAVSAETVPWSGVTDTPTTVEGYGIEDAVTKDQLIVSMDLVGSGTSYSPYAIQLNGVVQTFAQVKTVADTRNAVIRHGRGTYRVTYVGASEMMWDCTGTVQGEVKTGTIHMFAAGDVVQLVAARELATSEQVSSIGSVADEAAGEAGKAKEFSAYPMAAVEGGALEDRTINHATAGGTFTFPVRTGTNARDFVLVIDALTTAPTVTFPAGVTYVSDQDAADVWTAEADKMNAWYFSELTDGVFMVSHKAMSVIASVIAQ